MESKLDYDAQVRPQNLTVQSTVDNSGAALKSQTYLYSWSVGGNTVVLPNKCFMSATIEVKKALPGPVWGALGGDLDVCLAPFPIAGLFEKATLKIGGVIVSQISNNVAQCSALKYRTTKTSGWLSREGLAHGGAAYALERNAYLRERSTSDYLWEIPLAFFDQETPMGAGTYQLELTVNSNYLTSMVQTVSVFAGTISPASLATPAAVGDYQLIINDIFLNVGTAEMSTQPDGAIELDLVEMYCSQQDLSAPGTGRVNKPFDVMSSTQAIAAFLQPTNAGNSPYNPPQVFRSASALTLLASDANFNFENLSTILLQYAGLNYPQLEYKSEVGGLINTTRRRHNESMTQLKLNAQGIIGDDPESNEEWLVRGAHYTWDVSKAGDNRDTRVNAYLQMALTTGVDIRLGLICWYRTHVTLVRQSGMVVSVRKIDA